MHHVTTENAAEVAAAVKAAKEEAKRVQDAFAMPFDAADVKYKPAMVKNNRALALAYVDARLVLDRLDEVVGIDGWRDEYTHLPNGSVECRLSVRIAGVWVTKADVGSPSEQPDEHDRVKAAVSDALKRAAVKFGIGRFLYRMPQVWRDYDPVKKRFADAPPETPKPKPQAASVPSQAGPAKVANSGLIQAYRLRLTKCDSRKAFEDVKADATKDKQAGMLSDADINALLPAFKEAADKYPAPKAEATPGAK
jgi:hypothetical protein